MKKIIPSLYFVILIFTTAFLMEAIGTFISIVGLGALFAGDPVILLMAGVLDLAKIVSVSFVYQYWEKLKNIMKYYMLAAVIVLMTITSSGAFGYLSGAFQKAMQPGQETSLKVNSFKQEREQLINERKELMSQRVDIDKQIAQLPPEYVKGRQKLINSFKPESNRISNRLIIITKKLDELNNQVLKVESENIDKEVHVGPILYVAKAFDISVEQASKWIILIIIFVFDPLAIILIVAGNFLVKLRSENKEEPVKEDLQSLKDLDKLTPAPTPETFSTAFDDPAHGFYEEPIEDIKVDESEFIPDEFEKVKSRAFRKVFEPKREEISFSGPEYAYDEIDVTKLNEDLKISQEQPETITKLLSLIYDDIDIGEDPSEIEVDVNILKDKITNYIPVTPAIEVFGDMNYSGTPQVELIDEHKMTSSLELLKFDDTVYRSPGISAHSTKRSLYE